MQVELQILVFLFAFRTRSDSRCIGMLQCLGPVRRTDVVQQGREPLLRREVVLEALHEGVVPERGREALAQGLARPAAQPPVSQSASQPVSRRAGLCTAGGAAHLWLSESRR